MVYNWKNNPVVQDAISKISCYTTYFINIHKFNEKNMFTDFDFYEIYNPVKQYCRGIFKYNFGNGLYSYKYEVHHIIFYEGDYNNSVNSSVYVIAREVLTPEEKISYAPFCRCMKCRISNVFLLNLFKISCSDCLKQWGGVNQKIIRETRRFMINEKKMNDIV